MSTLNRDQLRVIVCFAGIFGLLVQLFAQTFFGAEIGAGLTGTFGTLATLPIVDGAAERYLSKRDPGDPGDPPDGPSPPTRDPSSRTPTPRPPSDPPPDDFEVRFSVVAA